VRGATTFILDGQEVTTRPGETIWEVARHHGREIPHLCLSTEPDFRADGNCRLCMVEVEGAARLVASCIVRPSPGAVVRIDSERARAARRTVMDLLLAEADIASGTEADRWARELGAARGRLPGPEAPPPPDESHPGVVVDLAACIRCLRCVQACREVEAYDVIGMANRGARCEVVFDCDDPMGESTCVSCGSCAQTCPTGAITFRVPR
jgi:formate dehydrogenase major subunit